MRKVLLMLCVAFGMGCSNGLNKPIIETLSVDELKANMESDTTFTDFYKDVQRLRSWVLGSDVNQAKWGNITYNDLKKYQKKVTDTTFTKKLAETFREEYKHLYPDYSSKVDSIMNNWREYKEQNKLETYVKIEFAELWKEYYSYSGDVKDVNVGFRVTPLKGTIEQLVFRYDIKSKISNSKLVANSQTLNIYLIINLLSTYIAVIIQFYHIQFAYKIRDFEKIVMLKYHDKIFCRSRQLFLFSFTSDTTKV